MTCLICHCKHCGRFFYAFDDDDPDDLELAPLRYQADPIAVPNHNAWEDVSLEEDEGQALELSRLQAQLPDVADLADYELQDELMEEDMSGEIAEVEVEEELMRNGLAM